MPAAVLVIASETGGCVCGPSEQTCLLGWVSAPIFGWLTLCGLKCQGHLSLPPDHSTRNVFVICLVQHLLSSHYKSLLSSWGTQNETGEVQSRRHTRDKDVGKSSDPRESAKSKGDRVGQGQVVELMLQQEPGIFVS